MTTDIKASFHPFDDAGLTAFYKENIEDDKTRNVMLAFGISPTMEENKDCLCRALSIQFRMFVGSNSDEVDDIVAIEYQKLLAEPKMKKQNCINLREFCIQEIRFVSSLRTGQLIK